MDALRWPWREADLLVIGGAAKKLSDSFRFHADRLAHFAGIDMKVT
jgi:hypothetical protein